MHSKLLNNYGAKKSLAVAGYEISNSIEIGMSYKNQKWRKYFFN